MSVQPESNIVQIRASSTFEDDEEALEALVNLKEIDTGDVFTDRETKLDSDESDGISIVFAHEDDTNILRLGTGPESNVEIILHLTENHTESASKLMNTLLSEMGKITLRNVIVTQRFDMPFHTLSLPIEEDAELDVVGIRLSHGGADYIIQETDDDMVSVTRNRDVNEAEEDEFPSDIGIADLEKSKEFINGLLS